MNKLSLEALKQRAEATTSKNLLATISGGTENCCHEPYADPRNSDKDFNVPLDKIILRF